MVDLSMPRFAMKKSKKVSGTVSLPTWHKVAWPVVAVVAIAALFAILLSRESGVKVLLKDGDRQIELEFDDNNLDMATILNKILSDEKHRTFLIATLANRHETYHKHSPHFVDTIRKEDGSSEFANNIRDILADLDGPFDRKYHTFYDIDDEDFIKALNEMELDHATVQQLRNMSVRGLGLFRPHMALGYVGFVESVAAGEAAVCFGGGLQNKTLFLTDEATMNSISVRAVRPIGPIGPCSYDGDENEVNRTNFIHLSFSQQKCLFGDRAVGNVTQIRVAVQDPLLALDTIAHGRTECRNSYAVAEGGGT